MTGDAAEIGGYDPVRSFEPPRAGFDLGTASSDALSRRGLPRRPDPEREPYLAERWASVFGRPLSIVGAELASDPLMLRGRKDALTSYRVDGWAGLGRAIVRRGISDPGIGGGPVPAGAYLVPATFVSAEWEVPRVMGDPANLDDYLSIWVGLDGFPEADDDLVEEPVPGKSCAGAWRSWPARVSSDGWRGQSGTPRSGGSAQDSIQLPGAVGRYCGYCRLRHAAACRDCVPGEPLPRPRDERRARATGVDAVVPLGRSDGGVDR